MDWPSLGLQPIKWHNRIDTVLSVSCKWGPSLCSHLPGRRPYRPLLVVVSEVACTRNCSSKWNFLNKVLSECVRGRVTFSLLSRRVDVGVSPRPTTFLTSQVVVTSTGTRQIVLSRVCLEETLFFFFLVFHRCQHILFLYPERVSAFVLCPSPVVCFFSLRLSFRIQPSPYTSVTPFRSGPSVLPSLCPQRKSKSLNLRCLFPTQIGRPVPSDCASYFDEYLSR